MRTVIIFFLGTEPQHTSNNWGRLDTNTTCTCQRNNAITKLRAQKPLDSAQLGYIIGLPLATCHGFGLLDQQCQEQTLTDQQCQEQTLTATRRLQLRLLEQLIRGSSVPAGPVEIPSTHY